MRQSLLVAALLAANGEASEADGPSGGIRITRSGTQPPRKGPAENFTGSVRVDPLFEPADPPHASGAAVTFDPGARSAWHTHPAGQILIVTAGVGRVQGWGGEVEEIRAGDVVWTPPGRKHWHGASATTGMTHIAIQERVGGKTVDWMEHVTDEQYHGAATAKGPPMRTLDEVGKVAPALERYTKDVLLGGVWKRPGLSPRDRSLVTVAALIARNQTIEINSLRRRGHSSPSTRRRKRSGRRAWPRMWARWRRDSSSTPATSCSMTSGCGPPSPLATGAW